MTEQILTLCRAMGAGQEELLLPLAQAAESRLAGRLKEGTAPEDCGPAFPLAAAMLVMDGLSGMTGGGETASFTAGDLTIRRESGGSGSGKSLLAHAILQLLPRNAQVGGTILYDGAPLSRERAEALRGREIALIPQGITWLDPMMKVGPQVRRGRGDRSTRARCRAALDRFGLGPQVEELYPFELSGGMARRLALARCLACGGAVLLLDEPFTGVDSQRAGRILERIRALGIPALLSSHQPGVVARCDRVISLEGPPLRVAED